MSLTADKVNQCYTQIKLDAVLTAKHHADAFVQRNLSSFLRVPKIEHQDKNGTVSIELCIDSNTLKNKGLWFLTQEHPEYLCPSVLVAVVEDAGRTVPAYQYFAQQLQYEINDALTPSSTNAGLLVTPVKIDIPTKYGSMLGEPLNQRPNLVLFFILEFGIIHQIR